MKKNIVIRTMGSVYIPLYNLVNSIDIKHYLFNGDVVLKLHSKEKENTVVPDPSSKYIVLKKPPPKYANDKWEIHNAYDDANGKDISILAEIMNEYNASKFRIKEKEARALLLNPIFDAQFGGARSRYSSRTITRLSKVRMEKYMDRKYIIRNKVKIYLDSIRGKYRYDSSKTFIQLLNMS
jgi:hypothetical protein